MIHQEDHLPKHIYNSPIYGDIIRSLEIPGINRNASLRKNPNPSLFEFLDILRSELLFISDFLMSDWDLSGMVGSISKSVEFVLDQVDLGNLELGGFGRFMNSVKDIVNDENSIESPVPFLNKWAKELDEVLVNENKNLRLFTIQEN
jgi:hypothetical protein